MVFLCRSITDIDANGGGLKTATPVENIYFPGTPPLGRYKFWVELYSSRGPVTFRTCLLRAGQPSENKSFTIEKAPVPVFEFDWKGAKENAAHDEAGRLGQFTSNLLHTFRRLMGLL